MMPTKRVVTTRISLDLIREALHFPVDSKIINARYDGHSDLLEVIIEHDELPPMSGSGRLPEITPTVTKKPTGKMTEEFRYTLDWCA